MTSEEFDALVKELSTQMDESPDTTTLVYGAYMVEFAHRLLEEIEKRAEPVAFCKEGELYWNQPVLGTTKEVGLYTFPLVKD